MPYNPSSFLGTPMFTISAGASRKECPVHSGLLSANSDAMRRLVEAKRMDHTIDWSRWDEASVDRYVQWLYTREYRVPEPKPSPNASGVGGMDTRRPRSSTHARHSSEASMPASPPATPSPPSSIVSGGDSSSSDCTSSALTLAPHSADSHTLDYNEAFMAHARLYILAKATATTQLVVVTIHRLAALLDEIRWIERCSVAAENFVDLARYVYKHTDGRAHREESLRRVISSFAAFNFERLDCPSMLSLMAEGGDFVIDVSRKVMKTLRKPALAAPPSPEPPIATKAKAKPTALTAAQPPATAPRPSTPSASVRRPVTTTTPSAPPVVRRSHGLSAKSALEAMKASPGLARKPSVARMPPQNPGVEAMRKSGLERKTSVARLSSTLERKPSHARLSFGK